MASELECVGDGLNFLTAAGEVGREDEQLSPTLTLPLLGGDCSVLGLILTDTGFESGSCCCLPPDGTLSGGPIGPSSRLRLRRFSNLFPPLLLSSELLLPLLLLLFPPPLFRSLRCRSSVLALVKPLIFGDGAGPVIGVIVIELGRLVCDGDEAMGMISMPGLLSKPMPVSTEL